MILLSEFKIIVAFIFVASNYIIFSKAIIKYKLINEGFVTIGIDKKVTPRG